MMTDTISRQETINAILRNLNEEEYRSSWESGAVKVMKDTLEKMPTADRPQEVVAQIIFDEEKLREIVKEAVERFKEEYEITDRPQGEWIMHIDDLFPCESTQECSICHAEQLINGNDDNYCPNCGAMMKGADDE